MARSSLVFSTLKPDLSQMTTLSDRLFGQLVSNQFFDDPAMAEDQYSAAKGSQFFIVGTRTNNHRAGGCLSFQDLVDLFTSTDIDSLSWLIQQDHFRFGLQPFG